MIPRVHVLVVGLSVAAFTLSAQRGDSDTISVDSARALLGTELLVVPGLPIWGIYDLSGRAVLVKQQSDSGQLVILREERGGQSIRMRRPADSIHNAPGAVEYTLLRGGPFPAERRLEGRRRHRYFEPLNVSVSVIDMARFRNWEAVLDSLAPLRR